MTGEAPPRSAPVAVGGAARALSVDVEEWYHNCWAPEYLEPRRRPPLPEELDRLLPAMLEWFEASSARATFFVLGEVARRLPGRIRELARGGHEVACHGDLHLRANSRPQSEFAADISRAKSLLEQLLGEPVIGFRAPEWSLRSVENPLLRRVAEAGFRYDSSLAPWVGAGSRANPRLATRFRWEDALELLEAPPLSFAGRLRLPSGGWTGRLARSRWILRAAEDLAAEGGLPLLVIHPWEIVDRPLPGLLTGFGRFFHEAGRRGFGDRCRERLRAARWIPLREAFAGELGLGEAPATAAPSPPARERSVA